MLKQIHLSANIPEELKLTAAAVAAEEAAAEEEAAAVAMAAADVIDKNHQAILFVNIVFI